MSRLDPLWLPANIELHDARSIISNDTKPLVRRIFSKKEVKLADDVVLKIYSFDENDSDILVVIAKPKAKPLLLLLKAHPAVPTTSLAECQQVHPWLFSNPGDKVEDLFMAAEITSPDNRTWFRTLPQVEKGEKPDSNNLRAATGILESSGGKVSTVLSLTLYEVPQEDENPDERFIVMVNIMGMSEEAAKTGGLLQMFSGYSINDYEIQ